ncbi:hypothetical protein CWI39_0627p0010 [Hamiltosporidium magnivora]|uniref:Uncharacterized protein n=1 Tax=Hamiltosporidium magnivora TaxID=148818 RepID=A0A4Q9LD39_9MICR|nr:hypothetical protein CWI39_0627p0010 [Hamiltosporidium magnivora]
MSNLELLIDSWNIKISKHIEKMTEFENFKKNVFIKNNSFKQNRIIRYYDKKQNDNICDLDIKFFTFIFFILFIFLCIKIWKVYDALKEKATIFNETNLFSFGFLNQLLLKNL